MTTFTRVLVSGIGGPSKTSRWKWIRIRSSGDDDMEAEPPAFKGGDGEPKAHRSSGGEAAQETKGSTVSQRLTAHQAAKPQPTQRNKKAALTGGPKKSISTKSDLSILPFRLAH